MAAACRALGVPVVSGNVSLYNETAEVAVMPTPTIGAVGLLEDFQKSARIAFQAQGEALLLIGQTKGWLGQSIYLREIAGREEGAPPPVDLRMERRNGDFVRGLISEGVATAVHDVSDGGLLVAIAEMAMASGMGAQLDPPPQGIAAHAFWFGEDQARYVITVKAKNADALLARCKAANIPVHRIGSTGKNTLTLPGEAIPIALLIEKFEGFLPAYMAGAH
jgi:phosphoribosylformylglycinamidine synthase